MSERKHLKRLSRTWQDGAVYFITTCVAKRRSLLATEAVHQILRLEFSEMKQRHGWAIGRYVIMPDHIHFFAKPVAGSSKPLSQAVGKWKEWTAKKILKTRSIEAPIWQPEFFDHVLRSHESRAQKWRYMLENPVRAKLVPNADIWPYAGHIDFE